MKGKGPHWPIDRIQSFVREDKVFIQKTRALSFFPTRKDAYRTIKDVALSLSVSMFSHTQQLTYDTADVYAVRIDGAGWYMKLYIDESVPELTIISFHPLERPLRTRGGEVHP